MPMAHLHVAFRHIYRRHSGVSETAGQGSSENSLAVVARIVRDRTNESMTVRTQSTTLKCQLTAHPTVQKRWGRSF
jgi:hypothetical protein